MNILEIFFQVLRSKFVKFLMSALKGKVNPSSNFASFFTILSSYFFNFRLKDLMKIQILRLSSALVKICHIPHVIFLTAGQLKVMLDKSVNKILGEEM